MIFSPEMEATLDGSTRLMRAFLRPILAVLSYPVMVLAPIIGFVFTFLISVPLLGIFTKFVYAVVIRIVLWLPLFLLLLGTSWMWERVPILRLPIALVGMPVAIFTYVVVLLFPVPDWDVDGFLARMRVLLASSTWPVTAIVLRDTDIFDRTIAAYKAKKGLKYDWET